MTLAWGDERIYWILHPIPCPPASVLQCPSCSNIAISLLCACWERVEWESQNLIGADGMTVFVQLFAGMKEALGKNQVAVELPNHASVDTLRKCIERAHPELVPLLQHARFAIDNTYVEESAVVPAEATVACIPPVSGG